MDINIQLDNISAVHVRQFKYLKVDISCMRKMILEIEPGRIIKTLQGNMLDHIEEFEMLELLRLDFEKAVKVVLFELTLKKEYTLEDIKWPKNTKITVLGQNDNKYIVIITAQPPNKLFKKLFNKAKIDVIWTTPTFYRDGKMTLSCIGEADELKKVIKVFKLFGTVSNISYHRPVFQEHNALSVLTEKQKEIIIAAKKYGYYDYPRKIDAGRLAAKVGVSKATIVEHLRKAEGRLMGNILAGY
jgi:hypothetical protein